MVLEILVFVGVTLLMSMLVNSATTGRRNGTDNVVLEPQLFTLIKYRARCDASLLLLPVHLF